ncbi:hypothetical protein [Streptococcus henryi]|nr:hypothetical protein [Streptococcus henryi]
MSWILVWAIIGGYAKFFRVHLKMDRRLVWIFTISSLTLLLYLASLFQFLLVAVWGISIVGSLLALYYIVGNVTKRDPLQRLDAVAIGMLLTLLLFAVTLWQSPLLHYDNFTHWATIVKFLNINNALPTQADAIIGYYTYPVGSSIFNYYVTVLVGFSDGSMLIAQLLLIFSSLYGMFATLKDSNRLLMSIMIFASFALFNYFNIAIRLNNLLVDYLLAAITLAVFSGFVAYKDRLIQLSLNTFALLGLLSIIKTSGLFFVALGLLVYVILSISILFKKSFSLRNIFLISTTIFLSALPYGLWQWHVEANFTNSQEAKHAISSSDLNLALSGKLTGTAKEILDHFLLSSFSLNSLASRGIILINVILLLSFIIIGILHKRPKILLLTWLGVDAVLIVYYIGILLMYLVAMPTDEAIVLAGFERYASTIVIILLGVSLIVLVREMDSCLYEQNPLRRNVRSYRSLLTKRLYQHSSLALLFFTVSLFLSENNGVLYNNKIEASNISQQIKSLVGDRREKSEERILVISADKENVDSYFTQYAARYYLWNTHVDAREDLMLSSQEFEKLLKEYDQVLVLDNHYTFNALTKQLYSKIYPPGLYQISDFPMVYSK